MTDTRRLVSPGPIADAFLQSRAFIPIIIGPVGSGKTLTSLQKGLRNGALQGGKVDDKGVTWRKARFGVIRESYPNLEANTLPSWFNIVPEEEGKFGWKAPYVHAFRKVLRREGNRRDGRPIDILDMQVEFRAIGDKSVEAITRGWEVNAVMVDEADLQPADLVSYLSGRVGRFSNLDVSLVRDPQIILCSNAPYTDNWLYKLAIDKELGELDGFDDPALTEALEGRPLVETFIQPGGREPNAENIHNLRGGKGYYVLQAAANKHRTGYVERMVDNKFVPMQHGQPVNPQFSFSEHVRPIEWDPRRKLILGVDQGLFAAAVAMQRTPMGQIRTLAECVLIREEGKSLRKIGPTAFGQKLRATINERFPDLRAERIDFATPDFEPQLRAAPIPVKHTPIPPHLDQYILYIINTGRVPLKTSQFDDDWEPVGPMVRRDLRNVGATLEDRGDLYLASHVSSGAALDQRVSSSRRAAMPNEGRDNLAIRAVADPAAFAADDREDNEQDWLLAFQKALGVKVHRAKSNRQALRLEAVHRSLEERDGYAIDPACKHLIRAHLGGYHYRKAEISDGEVRGHLEIADTIYTHVADAEQYAALEGEHVIGDIRGKERRRAPVKIDNTWNELGGF